MAFMGHLQRQSARAKGRQHGGFLHARGNLLVRKSEWWAREDSNLQPDRYERYALPGKADEI